VAAALGVQPVPERQTETYLLVLPWAPHHQGGVSAVVKHLQEEIGRQGWMRPRVAVNSWGDRVALERDDAVYLRLSLLGGTGPGALVKGLLQAPRVLWGTHRLLRERRVAVVNFHYPGLAALGVAILRRLGLFRGRLLLSYHGTDVRPASDRVERACLSFVLRAADALVACSGSLADRMAETLHVPRSRIHVVHNGVSREVFRPDAELPRTGRLAGLPERYLLSVGAFVPRKSHVTLLGAFRRLAGRYPDLGLVLAGADGRERPVIEELIAARGLNPRVSVRVGLGEEEVAYLLARAAVCVQPALAESFPLALLEAGAAGAPVVASSIAGHQELVADAVTGLLFPPRDEARCAEAIARMLDDPAGAARMAAALRQRVLPRFTWAGCAQEYRRLAAGAGGPAAASVEP
jgi:glycosyltransferase involved in cell wall biosynthesis